MKIHLISGACGFVGRNMVKRLYRTTGDTLFIVDDLSIGTHPSTWMDYTHSTMNKDLEIIGEDGRILFWKGDFRDLLFRLLHDPEKANERKRRSVQGLDFPSVFGCFPFCCHRRWPVENRGRPYGCGTGSFHRCRVLLLGLSA